MIPFEPLNISAEIQVLILVESFMRGRGPFRAGACGLCPFARRQQDFVVSVLCILQIIPELPKVRRVR
jgi:hypothetical protein